MAIDDEKIARFQALLGSIGYNANIVALDTDVKINPATGEGVGYYPAQGQAETDPEKIKAALSALLDRTEQSMKAQPPAKKKRRNAERYARDKRAYLRAHPPIRGILPPLPGRTRVRIGIKGLPMEMIRLLKKTKREILSPKSQEGDKKPGANSTSNQLKALFGGMQDALAAKREQQISRSVLSLFGDVPDGPIGERGLQMAREILELFTPPPPPRGKKS
jgi:hypothetical protein